MENVNLIAWLSILVILVVIEFLTMGLTTIWFAGGALVAAILSMFNTSLLTQIVVAMIVSLVLLFSTRPIAVKYFNKDRVRTNVESMIGRTAVVIGEVNNLVGIGQVNVGGQEWSARSSVESVVIPVGTVVEIINISGVKLIVKPVEQSE